MGVWRVVRGAGGFTLVELVVVLAVLGLMLGISGLALGSLQLPRESAYSIELRRARAEAIRSGIPRATHHARFLPDGRVIGADVDPLTGVPLAK
jgi:prepilin-type N-terminal cleavage/methylation domain-containing protein